jgi:hypothetical protein
MAAAANRTHKMLALAGSVGFGHHSVAHGGRPARHRLRHRGSAAMRLLRRRLKSTIGCNICSRSRRRQDSYDHNNIKINETLTLSITPSMRC